MNAHVYASLQNKIAIVTGAAGGIGLAIARRLVDRGVTVLGLDVSPTVTDMMSEFGGHALCGNLTDADFSSRAIDAAHDLGGLDILVNAAGIQLRTDAIDISEDGWQRLLDVNLSAVYRLIRQASKLLSSGDGGNIVNIASLSADRAVPGIVPYGATKSALVQLSKGLAVELGPRNIRVNAVSPGYIETAMTADVLAQAGFRAQKLARIPLQRFADGNDVADVVAFLASNAARYVTGVVLPVDGGYSVT